MSEGGITISKIANGTLPRVPFQNIKNYILGADYELSLVFIGSKKSEEMHIEYKRKDGPANILSFPLSETSGEIYIDLEQLGVECVKFGKTPRAYLGFLFIHGLLHLKGMTHGSRMEHEEKEACARFGF